MNANSQEYKQGYTSGLHSIDSLSHTKTLKERAQIAFNQSESDEDCDYKYGYQKAATENGAVDPMDGQF